MRFPCGIDLLETDESDSDPSDDYDSDPSSSGDSDSSSSSESDSDEASIDPAPTSSKHRRTSERRELRRLRRSRAYFLNQTKSPRKEVDKLRAADKEVT